MDCRSQIEDMKQIQDMIFMIVWVFKGYTRCFGPKRTIERLANMICKHPLPRSVIKEN